jgi:hypothetical protein
MTPAYRTDKQKFLKIGPKCIILGRYQECPCLKIGKSGEWRELDVGDNLGQIAVGLLSHNSSATRELRNQSTEEPTGPALTVPAMRTVTFMLSSKQP